MYCQPQYSPDLAPVEQVFGVIKRKLKNDVCCQDEILAASMDKKNSFKPEKKFQQTT